MTNQFQTGKNTITTSASVPKVPSKYDPHPLLVAIHLAKRGLNQLGKGFIRLSPLVLPASLFTLFSMVVEEKITLLALTTLVTGIFSMGGAFVFMTKPSEEIIDLYKLPFRFLKSKYQEVKQDLINRHNNYQREG